MGEPLLGMHEELALGAADAAQRALVVGGRKKQDLRILRAEEATGGHEELPNREAELRRALRRAHRLVEELQVLSLLALLHVAAERRDGCEHRHDEQEDGERAHLEELDDRQAE